MVEAEKKEQHLCGSFKAGIAGKAFSGRPALGKKWRKKMYSTACRRAPMGV
jgi:hypothetical protein